MFFGQYQHEPNSATMRYWLPVLGEISLLGKRSGGEAGSALMDRHFDTHGWFICDPPTLADICLFAYTHVAHDGGFTLEPFAVVRAWLDPITALRGFIAMAG